MAVSYALTLELSDIPPEVAAYANATKQPIEITVDPSADEKNDGWAIRLHLQFKKRDQTRPATKAHAYMFDGNWNWLLIGDLHIANDIAKEFAADQMKHYPGLTVVGP